MKVIDLISRASRWAFATTAVLLCCTGVRAASGPVIISEFMAQNISGLRDEDGAYSDWIELLNTSTNTVNLGGWSLTDSDKSLTKWRLPSTNVPPSGFLIVFASGKDRAIPGLPLHANFALNSKGGYLGLVEPDGATVSSEYKPEYPGQYADISYGLAQETEVTRFVSNTSLARIYVPTKGYPAPNWMKLDFDDSQWRSGTNGVGFETLVPGFAVRNIRANIAVSDLTTAKLVLANPAKQLSEFTETANVINYLNTGNSGYFLNDTTFPGFTIGVDEENYVTAVDGVITVPTAGWWTFAVSSDDGFEITIGTNTFAYPGLRGASATLGSFQLAAGDYPVHLVYFECSGGSELELFAAPGKLTSVDTSFALVGAPDGLAVKSSPSRIIGASLRPLIQTDVEQDMAGKASSALVRIPFSVTNPAAVSSVTLRMKYNDGFVAYLNGTEIARRNVSTDLSWNSVAAAPRPISDSVQEEDIDATKWLGLLQTGENVLAFQAVNESTTGGQFAIQGELLQIKYLSLANHYFSKPTPAAPNSMEFAAFVSDLKFTPNRGWSQNTNISVTITSATPGTVIWYTTNGTVPAPTNGMVYSGPIAVNGTTILRAIGCAEGFSPSAVETHSYIFLDQIQAQSTNNNYVGGSAGDYTLDPAITQGPYKDSFANALLSVPALSLVLANEDFFGADGLWSNPQGEGVVWERACSAEYIRPDGKDGFHVNCGLRIQGGVSRIQIPKHSLRLLFKGIYGPGKLDYNLYPDSPVKSFDTVVLHAGFNDQWLWAGSAATFLRDQFCRDTQNAMGGYAAHGVYVHLYINGLYWGLYNLGERSDDSFAASYLGGLKEDYDSFTANGQISGDAAAWDAILALADAGIATDQDYANISEYIDIPNFIDYLLMNFYVANEDWPNHNWAAARRRVDGAGMHFSSWDAEWIMGIGSDPLTDRTGLRSVEGVPARIYTGLRLHPEFRQLFGDRAQKHCFNSGALTPGAIASRWAQRAKEIDQAIICEAARWGNGNTRDAWLSAEQQVRSWFPQRTATLISQLRRAGLFSPLDAPSMAPYGGLLIRGSSFSLTNPNPSGKIYYTIDGADPRRWGGGLSSSARLYSKLVTLTNAAYVKARVLDGTNWSALVENSFYIVQDFSKLAVTEIMYNPPNLGTTNGNEFEYIELKNTGTTTLDLSGLQFTAGISFTFSNSTRLAPGQYFLLVCNPVAFAKKYPGVTINGVYTGKLSSGGERITLTAPLGTNVFSFSYKDQVAWPQTADGLGYSMVRVDTKADPGLPSSWRASTKPGGSPGAADPSPNISPVIINEVLTHARPPQLETIELYNPTSSNALIGGWFLSNSGSDPMKFQIPAKTVIRPHGYITFTEEDFNSNPGSSTNFSLSSQGDSLYLFSAKGDSLTGYSHSLHYEAAAAGVSFGRYMISTGKEFWPAQSALTLGTNNSAPNAGPVVINEIMYHPAPGGDEFIELFNLSSDSVPLYDLDYPTNGWRLKGVAYTFTNGIVMPPGGFLMLVSSNPELFRSKYNISDSVPVLGPYVGRLQTDGELLQLQRPGVPGTNGVPYITVDEVEYQCTAPWPSTADGKGPSLQRRHPADYGNEPTNWFGSGITPGLPSSFNKPPICNLLSPMSGSSYNAPAAIPLETLATDPDGVIAEVSFFDNGVLIATITNAPFSLTWTNAAPGKHTITAIALDRDYAVTESTPVAINVNAPPIGTGTGLLGEYYDNIDFTGTEISRIDPNIDFQWFWYAPDPAISLNTFSVRWTGKVQPRATGAYTFYTLSDDGVRLWVNDQLLIDNWRDHPATEDAGIITLQAGIFYNIKMEYYQNVGDSVVQLLWSGPDTAKQLISSNQLYLPSVQNQAPSVNLVSPFSGTLVDRSEILFTAEAYDPDGSIAQVDFYAGDKKIGSVFTAPFSCKWTNASPGDFQLFAAATDDKGLCATSNPVVVSIVPGISTNIAMVGAGSVWDYNDTGANLGDAWSSRNFQAVGWSNGPAPLGYGNGDERTIVSYGPTETNKLITAYFRTMFIIDNAAAYEALSLNLRGEDGIIVYVNGSEVYRGNMAPAPADSGTVALTNAVDADATNFHNVMISAGYLVPGTNVLAAEVHLAGPDLPSLGFDAELSASRIYFSPSISTQPEPKTVNVGEDVQFEVAADGSSPLGYLWLLNEEPIGGTNALLDLTGVLPEQAGSYRVIVFNPAGAVTSQVANLEVVVIDSDGDGMPDYWEIAHHLDPNVDDSGLDADGDGFDNLQEYRSGTDPQDPASPLKLRVRTLDKSRISLEFLGGAGRSYTIQSWSGIQDDAWMDLTKIDAVGTNSIISVQIPLDHQIRFYRVVTPGK